VSTKCHHGTTLTNASAKNCWLVASCKLRSLFLAWGSLIHNVQTGSLVEQAIPTEHMEFAKDILKNLKEHLPQYVENCSRQILAI